MTKSAVISTSIHENVDMYHAWKREADYLIVAGDVNSHPHLKGFIEELGGIYLTPDAQKTSRVSDIIGWRSIQRRNAALLAALRHTDADIIISVDDDNVPDKDGFIKEYDGILHTSFTLSGNDAGWYNPGGNAIPSYRQRGVPIALSPSSYQAHHLSDDMLVPAVAQSMVLGDPDCDALERIVNYPRVVQVIHKSIAIAPGVWAPFNSQATAWDRKYAWLAGVWPGVGRFDDIFAAYVAQYLLWTEHRVIHFGHPLVRQYRNPHNYVRDVEGEWPHLVQLPEFIRILEAYEPTGSLVEDYRQIAYRLHRGDVRPDLTWDFLRAWVKDIHETGVI